MEPRVQIPTDSYYKFCTFIGLAIYVATIVFIASLTHNIPLTRDEVQREIWWGAAIAIMALLVITWGLRKWRTVHQKHNDAMQAIHKEKNQKELELLSIQIEKAKLELFQMRQVKCSRKRG